MLSAALGVLLLTCGGTVVVGSEQPVRPDNSGVGDVSITHADPEEQAEKERVVTAAVLLLVLVIGVVAGLLVVVVLWGRRVRRAARKPTARIVPGDELWYLKPSKNEVATRPTATPQQDESTERDTDLLDGP